jgi:hypothetical protein
MAKRGASSERQQLRALFVLPLALACAKRTGGVALEPAPKASAPAAAVVEVVVPPSFAPPPPDASSAAAEPCRCTGTVNIADPGLRKAVTRALKLDGPISAERACETRELRLHNALVDRLDGLECFQRLERLLIAHGTIEDLSVVAQLPRLKELSITSQRVRDLTLLTALKHLENLHLQDNRILDLAPLGSLTKLTSLGVGSNCVTDLTPLSKLTNLTNLTVSFNYVTDLAPLAGMTRLEHLGLSGNYFKSLTPLASLYELHSLSIDSTGQKDLSALTALKRFNFLLVQRNPIDCDGQAKNLAILDEYAKLNGGSVAHDCTELARRARAQGRRDELSTPVVRNKSSDARCKAERVFPKKGSLVRAEGRSPAD